MAMWKVCLVLVLGCNMVSALGSDIGLVELGHNLAKYRGLFSSATLGNISSECGSKILHMINRFMQDDNVLEAFMNSGKGINDLGSYKTCTENNKNRYVLLSVNNLPLVFNFGICGPYECQLSDYALLKRPIASIITELIQSIKPPESDVDFNVTEKDVEFRDALNENRLKTQLKVGTIATCLLGLLFIGLSVTVSLRNFMSPPQSEQLTKWDRVLNSFDLLKNVQTLGHVDPRQDQNLRVFNGIRVLAMLWIVFGHSFMICRMGPSSNPEVGPNYLTEFSKAHLYNASLSVDVFFFLSGFLLCFIVLSSPGSRLNWKLYLHRLIRLYPALIVTYLVYVYVMPCFGDGPRFYVIFDETEVDCPKIWPYAMFFLYNFRPREYDCIGWVWYLSNDMQFFIITPLLLYLLLKRWRIGLLTIVALIIGSYVSTFVVAYKYDIYASMSRYSNNWEKYYYDKPYARIPTYLIGLLFGYWYLQSKREGTVSQSLAKMMGSSPVMRWVCYILGFTGCFFMVHVLYWMNKYPKDYPRSLDASYLVFSRSVFIFSLCLLTAPALVGKGRLLHLLLSNNLMTVLSKLTYGVYMLHLVTNDFFMTASHIPFFSAYEEFVFWFWGNAPLAYIAATALFVFVEMPIFNIEDLLLKSRGPRPPLPPTQIQSTTESKKPQHTMETLSPRGPAQSP